MQNTTLPPKAIYADPYMSKCGLETKICVALVDMIHHGNDCMNWYEHRSKGSHKSEYSPTTLRPPAGGLQQSGKNSTIGFRCYLNFGADGS